MEILQTLLTTLTMPNEGLINLVSIFYRIIESIVTMLFFTTLLNINSTKKQQLIFIILSTVTSIIYNYLIPTPFNTFIQMITLPILIILCFKTTILKGIIAQILPLVVIMTFETFLIRVYTIIFNISYLDINNIPIYRLSITLIIYLAFYLLYKLSKHFNFNISVLDNMNKNITLASLLGLIAIFIQICLINFCNYSFSLIITIL